jgi:hypothetical protein
MQLLQQVLPPNTFHNLKRSILRRIKHHRLPNSSERRQISSKK